MKKKKVLIVLPTADQIDAATKETLYLASLQKPKLRPKGDEKRKRHQGKKRG